jgi:hypothetical protein
MLALTIRPSTTPNPKHVQSNCTYTMSQPTSLTNRRDPDKTLGEETVSSREHRKECRDTKT